MRGDTYFYQNPLECDTTRARWSWHECPCCPPMFLKAMGAMPGYIYATDEEGVYVNLFVGGHATIEHNGTPLIMRQTTRYPWDGRVRIAVEPQRPMPFAVMIRIPGWCNGETLTVNGQRVQTESRVRGYVRLHRTWQAGDVIDLDMPMSARRVHANPLVQADAGRVAIMRGPLVYCFESADNDAPVRTVSLPAGATLSTEFTDELPAGIMTVKASATAKSDRRNGLYFSDPEAVKSRPTTLTAIPYYANANRGPVDMAVWVPVTT